jgi:hypothetical protein
MAEAAYATGPALLGAPRFSLLFFCSLIQRGVQTVRQCGASKSPSPPENSRPQNIGPICFLFVPCFSVSARGAKEPKVPIKRYKPPRFKNRGPKVRGPKRYFFPCFSAGSKQRGALKSPRPPKAKPQTKKTARPKS